MTNTKSAVTKARRSLKKLGFILQKSRSCYPPYNFGGYRILDSYIGNIVDGYFFELDIEDVEKKLSNLSTE